MFTICVCFFKGNKKYLFAYEITVFSMEIKLNHFWKAIKFNFSKLIFDRKCICVCIIT